MTIARVWGTSLGFPNPGLQPTKHEWDEQRRFVREAVSKFEKAGHKASGLVLATRRPNKRIRKEAALRGMDAIVMGGRPSPRAAGGLRLGPRALPGRAQSRNPGVSRRAGRRQRRSIVASCAS